MAAQRPALMPRATLRSAPTRVNPAAPASVQRDSNSSSDVAGNISPVTSFSFTLDTTRPAAPGVALTSDTGTSSSDGITQSGTLTLSAVETGASVDRGEAEAAFLLRATRIEDVWAVARRGEVMPQKSTFFYPKLTSGLLLFPL